MKMELRTLRVEKFKSGPREGDWRTFEIPDDAQVVDVTLILDRALVRYVAPVSSTVPVANHRG